VKEVWGAGQQQVRNIWCNMAVYHLNLWIHTLVELWSWNRSHDALCDRGLSPWDDADRRPSHADRRKALRRHIIEHELSTLAAVRRLPRKILQLSQRLMELYLTRQGMSGCQIAESCRSIGFSYRHDSRC
jgi:hypothetical protein